MTTLNTNLAPAQAFLIDANGDIPPGAVDGRFRYHATSYRNLQSIKTYGLDPSRGGGGGSGDLVGGELGADFNDESRNKVHGTSTSSTANFYSSLRDQWADRLAGRLRSSRPNGGDFAVILRVPIDMARWEPDPRDPDPPRDPRRDAWRTIDKIEPAFIQALTTEGWVNILSLTHLDNAL